MAESALDPPNWQFDVATSLHDAVKVGVTEQRLSRVTVSRQAFPSWVAAMDVAGCLAVAVHGGMPTRIDPII